MSTTEITGSPWATSSSFTISADVATFSSIKVAAPNASAVMTRSCLPESPMTTTGASGKLAFAALTACNRSAVSRTPIRINTCSPALAIVLGTSSALDVMHTGLNGLFAKIALRPSRASRLGWTTTHTMEGILGYPTAAPELDADHSRQHSTEKSMFQLGSCLNETKNQKKKPRATTPEDLIARSFKT